ncbi:MAG: class I tRNA ligase family protein [Patescibacteria group bacterium]
MKNYDHTKIERKWQKEWEAKKLYHAKTKAKGKKFYGLIEFPYPSGSGLHVGHIRSNTAMDIITRKRRMEGYNVLYPIGWDAFGLPTENYAIKTGKQPEKVTKENTDMFRKQLKACGFGFDWSREINTTNPAYYKWTQWIFLQFYKKGLAYKTKTMINWCPKDKIGLANEEVVNGRCDRCDGPVEKREKEQWMLAITKYADRLDKDLDDVNYLEKIKIQQRNWIGKSEGSEIDFTIKNFPEKVTVFTTRADTLYSAFAVILAPEHSLVESLKGQIENWSDVEKYISDVKKKTDIERTAEDKEKTGIELKGIRAINPINNEEIPVWIADFVLVHYGTGAIFADIHDERDHAFGKKYGLPMRRSIEPVFHASDHPIRDGLPVIKRNAICAVIRNPKDDTYLCSVWRDMHMHGLITGGVEDGEDMVKAAMREIYEETGYKNVKLVNNPDIAIHSTFFHRKKQENRWARFQYMFFDLIDKEKDEIDEKEAAIHDVVWKKRSELDNFFSVVEGEFVLNLIDTGDYIHTGEGILSNSGPHTGMTSEEARKKITEAIGGKIVTKYKLRDWVFSRQRYWGEPIPIIHCQICGYVPVPEKDLPILLPKVKSYTPTDTGESPLAAISTWVNTTCPHCKGKAKRETDTMPNWAGSSWYYLRYTDSKNKKEFASPKALSYWMSKKSGGVDWYNGGMEHTTLHLLYSRFWHKFLYDLKLVPTHEPYMKRTSHGMILADDGSKISKSKENGVNPIDVIKTYGADTLRVHEMFMGPFDQAVPWNSESLIGSRRFLEKVWRAATLLETKNKNSHKEIEKTLHKTIKKVTEDIETMSFNTAVSSMMVLVNEIEKQKEISRKDFMMFLRILCPFAPFIAEELWHQMGEKKSIHRAPWPAYDSQKIIDEEITIVFQVNGRVRTERKIPRDLSEEEIKALAISDSVVIPWIDGKEIKKIIYVPGRLVNIVV